MSQYVVTLVERLHLNPGSSSETYHLTFAHNIPYQPGNSIGIYPTNRLDLVDEIARYCSLASSEADALHRLLSVKMDLIFPSRSFWRYIQEHYPSAVVDPLLSIPDILRRYPVSLPFSLLPTLLSPIRPRWYSIASSPVFRPGFLDILVKRTYWGEIPGLATEYLTQRIQLGESIKVLHMNNPRFTLTSAMQNKPLLMIGAGTGIAPFKSFMEHRLFQNESRHWIFFGERHRSYDFYYQTFWDATPQLRITPAFSREEPKHYVQDLLLEHQDEVWSWIEEGFLCLCGKAFNMGQDVERTLLSIIRQHLHSSETEALCYLKTLTQQNRYLKEVY